jgi:glycosyltransferase involved in cell wall biosynthesis
MAEIVPLCDAAVSASRYEGLPFNLMEAMACGLPILASDIKGHRDLLAGTDGTLFRDRAELICGLGELYAAGKRTARYANLGNYALPAAQAALEKVYENCLGVRRTAPAR